MKRITIKRRADSGFSLLEVLVAVVVLATGLLALAALQGALARNSADAKARSRVTTFLANQMDEIRAGGYDALAAPAATTVTADASADCSDTSVLDAIDATACEAAVNGLQLTTTVSEFAASAGAFVLGPPTTPTDAQFKHVVLRAQWTDATGAQRMTEQATVLSALALQLNSPLVTSDPGGFTPMGPMVRQENPFEEGMIPIAIGDGSETAATNPKPVVVGTNNTVTETKFNIFTYRDQGSSGTLIQQRIETTVVGCKCSYDNDGQLQGVFSQNFRPTYWNGNRYVPPEMLGDERPALAGPAIVDVSVEPQSDLCTDCCRDHHDLDEDEIKFDPYREDSHGHYRRSGNTLIATSSGEYEESCRLVRVDGLWRVAMDFNTEHVGYLATGPSQSSQVPDPDYAEYYEEFIVDSLRDLFETSDGLTLAERYDSPARLLNDSPLDGNPGATSPPSAAPADSQDVITILADPSDRYYLHTRSLLLDYIVPDAQQAIDNALADCEKTGDAKIECALPHIPFTTINVTELARYHETDPDVIDVVDGGVNFNDPLIIQGLVSGRSTASTDDRAMANTRFLMSNTALASVDPIDPGDRAVWSPYPDVDAADGIAPEDRISDRQHFIALNLSDDLVGDDFTVTLNLGTPTMSDNNQGNDTGVRWQIGGGFKYPCGPTTNATGMIPSLCETNATLGQGVGVKAIVSGYNYWVNSTDTTTLTCPNSYKTSPQGTQLYGTVTRAQFANGRVCRRYGVTAATSKNDNFAASSIAVTAFAGSAQNGASEETTITFDGSGASFLTPNDNVTVTFQSLGIVEPQIAQCNYSNLNSGRVGSVDWTSDCDYP